MTRFQANFLLLMAAALWGSGNVGQQQLLTHMEPLMANALKSLVAICAILPMVMFKKEQARRLDRRGYMLLTLSAIFFTLATTLNQASFGLTSVTSNGFLVNTCTIFTPVLALVVMHQRPPILTWPAAALAFFGIALLSGDRPEGFGWGETLCLGAALSYAAWMVVLGEFVSAYGRAGLVTSVQFLAAGLWCLVASLGIEHNSWAGVSSALPLLVFVGVVSTGGGYLLQAIGQAHTSASEAAVIVSAEAIFAAMAGHVLLGERLAAQGYLALLIIGSAIVLVQLPVHVLGRWSVLHRPRPKLNAPG